ncbi:molybdopterin-dependent oxidoreductase [Massilia sp. W12]|uniref:molybdopterin-dependent oxidoreductase n=1 Tax=Massilia sp. W12 TaxID=3126507 RepID=UPI0030CB54F3
MEQIAYRTCPFCEACCGLQISHDGAQVLRIRGNQDDVFSQGYLCPKGLALKDLHEDPDRLRTPMRRQGDGFVPISWEEAWLEIERRLPQQVAQYGAHSVALAVGNPTVHKAGALLYFPRLAHALGSRNIFSASTLDQMPRQLASALMYGSWFSVPVPDIVRCNLLVIMGGNPAVSNGSMWTVPDFRSKARALRARGGRMVTIDPRKTETAELSDQHLAIRPGSDVYFLLALGEHLYSAQLTRSSAALAHTRGLEQLPALFAPWPAERVAARCGIPAADIRALAQALAQTDGAALYGRIGVCTQAFGAVNAWLIDIINLLCGNLDVAGGMMFPKAAAFAPNTEGKPGFGPAQKTGRRHARVSGAPEVMGELPISCLAQEIETPGAEQVRALITFASNPVLSAPNGARLAAALEQLDFMLSIDIYINETTRHADLILPGRSPLEDSHFDIAFPQFAWRNFARYSEPVFASEQTPEWQILLQLAAIFSGQGHLPTELLLHWDEQILRSQLSKRAGPMADALLAASADLSGPERLFELALRSGPYGDGFGKKPGGLNLAQLRAARNGVDLGELQARLPELLRMPDGLLDAAPAQFVADLARAAAAFEDSQAMLQLVGRRDVRSGNSWMHNLPVLAKGPERCLALTHPADAAQAGVADGALAWLENPHGRLQVRIAYDAGMRPGVISLPHGWGHDLAGVQLGLASAKPGVNLNQLMDDAARDPLSGTSVLSGVAVRLRAMAD